MTQLGEALSERHAIGAKQAKFRENYQAQIHPWYSGPVHIGVIYVVGLALFTFMALGTPFALLLAWAINPNAGYILMVTIVGQYLIYETFHYCCHVRDNPFVRHAPFINTIRRHHFVHHNQGVMMEHNMNLTFPIADWVMGTSDLDRGLLGHVFNGYSMKHVKPQVRTRVERFMNDAPANEPRLAQPKAA